MNAEPAIPPIPPEVLEYLESQHTMTVATAWHAIPHAATVVYVNHGIVFEVCMRRNAVTARNIVANGAVAFTIDQYNPDWNKAKGIVGTGEATEIVNPERIQRIVLRFQDKFPFLGAVDTAHLTFFEITPTSIEYIDNEHATNQPGNMTLDYARSVVYNVFHDLPRQEVEQISASLETLSVPAGTVIVRQGDVADRFFIIVEGEVEVSREVDGEPHTVAYLGRGQFFGEMAVIMETPRTATITARVPTQLLAMPRDMFRTLVAQSLSTSYDFDAIVNQRLDELARLGGS
jgi:CRP-like cAMP-binding protein/nitroimidazol reductase NimA-like FMN-containing flavoprotein (pyridoxamine 5'-phosphate oxidase superfamily)